MKTFFAMLLHPFTVTILSLIVGSLFIFNNDKYADSTIPTWFYGSWSLYVGALVYLFGASYLGYSIYKTIKDNQKQ